MPSPYRIPPPKPPAKQWAVVARTGPAWSYFELVCTPIRWWAWIRAQLFTASHPWSDAVILHVSDRRLALLREQLPRR